MILVLIGIGFVAWVLFHILRYRKLRKWQVVGGIINNYSTETFKQSQVYVMIEMIHPIIQYTYEIKGKRYTGTKFTLEDHSLKSNPESNPTLHSECSFMRNKIWNW